MIIAHNIGKLDNPNYNTKEEILSVKETLTFDGVYRNIWENRDIIKEVLKTQKVILFIMGGYVGGNNKFDFSMPYEPLADWNQIMELAYMGCELGWHTWTHPDLTKIEKEEDLIREITPPFLMKYFAYPYGRFNDKIIEITKKANFFEAVSVEDVANINNSNYQRLRKFIKK